MDVRYVVGLGLAFASATLFGCAATTVSMMRPGEKRTTCEYGGRNSFGTPYAARIRVPTCLKLADEAQDEATRQYYRAKACIVAYEELSHPPDGMPDADCARAAELASANGGSLGTESARALTRAACDHSGKEAAFCKVSHKEQRELSVSIEVALDGNNVVATLKKPLECRLVTAIGKATTWEACGEVPLSNETLVFISSLLENATPRLSTKTDREGRATFDLSAIRASANFGRKMVGGGVNTHGEVRYFAPTGGQTWKQVDLSQCPLFSTWSAAADQQRSVTAIAEAAAGKKKQEELAQSKRECAADNAAACFKVGSVLHEPFGDAEDEGDPYMRKACDLKFSFACSALAHWKQDRMTPAEQSSADDERALATDLAQLKERCDKGAQQACALMNFTNKCAQGISSSCDSMGNAYLGGAGLTKDLQQTKRYWLRACRVDPTLCAGYAVKFYNTAGFANREQTADEFFELGCEGDRSQCVSIGSIFLRGAGGVSQDKRKAKAYFQRACDAKIASGCQSLQLK